MYKPMALLYELRLFPKQAFYYRLTALPFNAGF